MKKVMFLMIAAIIFGSGVFGQEDDFDDSDVVKQPRFLIGGNVAFNFAQVKSTDGNHAGEKFLDEFEFHFKPYFGYYISDKVTIGVKLGLNHYENAFADPHPMPNIGGYFDYELGITDGNSFEIAPFLRFQDTLVGKFRYYIDFSIGTEFSGTMTAGLWRCNGYYLYDESSYKLNYYYANLDVGILFLLSKRTGIEFQLAGIELGKRYEKFDIFYNMKDSLYKENKLETINFDFFSDLLQPNLGIVVNF